MAAKKKNKRRNKKPAPPTNDKQLASSFYQWDGDTLILNILGTPAAKRDAIGKPRGNQLRVSVKALPRAGRATDYMVKFLAGEFGVKPSAIEVVFGRTNVNKQLRIHAPRILPRSIDRMK